LYPALIGVLIGNVIEAGADIGGIAAAIQVLLPVPAWLIIIPVTAAIFALQLWGSYTLIRNIFRWLALTLLAYVGAAIIAKPDWLAVLKGTLLPAVHFDQSREHVLDERPRLDHHCGDLRRKYRAGHVVVSLSGNGAGCGE
jgi:Mn2+/Fe2+ NRAMP family transporter